MEPYRHLFLTGDRQVGKSTLLRHALQACGLRPAGFETRPFFLGGRRMGYVLHATGPLPEGYGNDTPICVFPASRPVAIPEVFDGFGAALLRTVRDEPLILMDELGRLERSAPVFQAAVIDCLDGPGHVVGVLQKTDQPLLRQIAARADTLVLTVTPENRDALLPQLTADISHRMGLKSFLPCPARAGNAR